MLVRDQAGNSSKVDLVVRLSDGKVRQIVPQPGYQVHWNTVAVTGTHVYWAEGERPKYNGQVAAVFRHELAKFDSLGVPFGGD